MIKAIKSDNGLIISLDGITKKLSVNSTIGKAVD